jgi:glycosyltransferase involved in cell wall biosynthesis
MCLPDLPLVLTLLEPDTARDASRWISSFPTDAVVVTGTQAMRSRLVAAGIVPERVAVIRGPVDFKAVNQARQTNVRGQLVGGAAPVLLMPGPPSSRGGQYYGLWAAAIVGQVHPTLRVILPYESSESRRLRRFVEQIGMASLLIVPPPHLTWAELSACADVFVCPAVDEVRTEPIAMAMAAGVPVVATAVRSVAELIADHENGLLCKPRQPRRLAGCILTAIEERDLCRRLVDVGRAQAYESFSLAQFLDNYARLYDNVSLGMMPGDGVRDTLRA